MKEIKDIKSVLENPLDFIDSESREEIMGHQQNPVSFQVCLLPAILQVVEKAFRVYKVYKELERVIRHAGIAMSVDKVLDIAKTYCENTKWIVYNSQKASIQGQK